MKGRTAAMMLAAALVAAAVPPSSTVRAATEASNPQQGQQKARISSVDAIAHAARFFSSGHGGSRGYQRRRGPGWTNRHVQRMALKKRNQQRHRRACRGTA